VKISIAELSLDPRNARKHSQRNLEAIAASLEKFGQRKPIVVHRGVVLAGNGTLEAAKTLGWTEIDVAEVPDDWDNDTAKAYALADNRTAELAEWDESELAKQLLELVDAEWDITELGFEVPPLADIEGDKDEDEAPEPPVEPKTKIGDIYQLGRHRLMCGDSTDKASVERLMNGVKNLIGFTSPPYNAGSSAKLSGNMASAGRANLYEQYDDEQTPEQWATLCSQVLENMLIYCDCVIYNIQLLGGNKPIFFQWMAEWSKHLVDVAIWDKEHGAPHVAKNVMGSQFEFLMIFAPKNNPTKAIPTANFQGTVQNVYSAPPQRDNDYASIHGATFPVHLPQYVMKTFSTNQPVMDLFAGTGTTLIAAEKLYRTAYLMELDPKYCDVIVTRWENLTGLKAELVTVSN
jgi:DNA modification methylase